MSAADHLQVPRQHGLFRHHGIDLGDGTVAHYLEGRQILRSPLDAFSRGQPLSVVTYDSCSPVGVTLRRAMGRLGEQNYNLLFNNCEHFAHWCKTGRHRSRQVEQVLESGRLGVRALGQWLPGAVIQAARLLIQQGLADPGRLEQGRDLARRTLRQLDGLRQRLQARLDQHLAHWEPRQGEAGLTQLRLAAQTLADQLSTVEELEQRLSRLLEAGPDPDPPE
ncbi:MAG: lecithin retinol acyltransferase family protein [Cyanobacteriota bacterium]